MKRSVHTWVYVDQCYLGEERRYDPQRAPVVGAAYLDQVDRGYGQGQAQADPTDQPAYKVKWSKSALNTGTSFDSSVQFLYLRE